MKHSSITIRSLLWAVTITAAALSLISCGGGSGDAQAASAPQIPIVEEPAQSDGDQTSEGDDEQNGATEEAVAFFDTPESTSRFLSRATFGARIADIEALTGTSASRWFLEQLSAPTTYLTDSAEVYYDRLEADTFLPFSPNTMAFWSASVNAPDQLRLRMVYALSQIIVVSDFGGELLSDVPSAVGFYLDTLSEHALGNYGDLLKAITYTPAMGHYLTYMGNLPADAATGRMPDENYARETLQLFSIGLLELNNDGTVLEGPDGQPLETYTNTDITGLARVFTGLNLRPEAFGDEGEESDSFAEDLAAPMEMYNENHATEEKAFLGTVIPAGTPGDESISMALETIMAHPNVGPFVSRQLIQRFTESDPSPAYVAEVATAFNDGRYILPDNTAIGDGRKGDLSASIAAVLFSEQRRMIADTNSVRSGKAREPILRFIQWARAFEVDASYPELNIALIDTGADEALGQHPFRSRSVFNFYRPGYVAPGTESGAAGMTVPELQITNASSIPGYINFMTYFTLGITADGEDLEELEEEYAEFGYPVDEELALNSFVPRYERELALAKAPAELVQHLDLLLTGGELSTETVDGITTFLEQIPMDSDDDSEGAWLRVVLAVLMTVTAPDYLVQG